MDEMKRCAECAMEIRAEARRCPHCRSLQPGAEPLHRGGPERLVGGVCTGLAHHLGLDVVLVRVAFIVALAMSFGTAVGVYLLLWVLTPPAAGARSPIQRAAEGLGRVLRSEPPPVNERRV